MANPLVCRSLAGCGKRFKKDVARWCCSTCDFDLCDTCSLDVVTEEADFAAAAADEAIRMIDEAEAEVAAADRPEAEARACSGCGLALLEQRQHAPDLACGGGCERKFAAGQSRWSCANLGCQIEICAPCLEAATVDASSPDVGEE